MKAYDLIILGAGVTGLAAGMYAGRLNLKTLVLGASSASELPVGGIITLTDTVENYPGFKKITGVELAQKMHEHALDYSSVTVSEEHAQSVKKSGNCFNIKTDKSSYTSPAIIFATGTKWRELSMKGAVEFKNRGVHYCALCDGPLYRNKEVAVIGGSDSAAKEALFLAEHARKVYVIFRAEKIRAEPVNEKLIDKNNKIVLINGTNIMEINGEKMVSSILLDKPYKGKSELGVNAVFGAIGHIPLSDLAKPLGVKLNDKGEIMIDRTSSTNVPGIFAAGDVVDSPFKQAITGVAEGVNAAYSAFTYIKKHDYIYVVGDPD